MLFMSLNIILLLIQHKSDNDLVTICYDK